MAGNFSYLSILNPGFTAPASTSQWTKAGDFAYVSFLNPPSTAGGTVTTTGAAFVFADSNNMSFGTSGSIVTATAGFATGPRSQAWSNMGVWVGSASPGPGVVYSAWVGGATGYFMWVNIP